MFQTFFTTFLFDIHSIVFYIRIFTLINKLFVLFIKALLITVVWIICCIQNKNIKCQWIWYLLTTKVVCVWVHRCIHILKYVCMYSITLHITSPNLIGILFYYQRIVFLIYLNKIIFISCVHERTWPYTSLNRSIEMMYIWIKDKISVKYTVQYTFYEWRVENNISHPVSTGAWRVTYI